MAHCTRSIKNVCTRFLEVCLACHFGLAISKAAPTATLSIATAVHCPRTKGSRRTGTPLHSPNRHTTHARTSTTGAFSPSCTLTLLLRLQLRLLPPQLPQLQQLRLLLLRRKLLLLLPLPQMPPLAPGQGMQKGWGEGWGSLGQC